MNHPDVHCDRCGAVLEVDWVEITTLGDAEPRYVQGYRELCPTKGCGTTCPICHRPPGDIHSGACGPVMATKADDPTRVTCEDCLAVVR